MAIIYKLPRSSQTAVEVDEAGNVYRFNHRRFQQIGRVDGGTGLVFMRGLGPGGFAKCGAVDEEGTIYMKGIGPGGLARCLEMDENGNVYRLTWRGKRGHQIADMDGATNVFFG